MNSNIKSLVIPDSVINIGEEAFLFTEIESINFPASIDKIEKFTFSDNHRLKKVSLADGLTTIGYAAFSNCDLLSSLTIPKTVTTFENLVFSRCKNLNAVYFEGDAPVSFGDEVFIDCHPDLTLYYHEGAEGWTSPTWNGCKTAPW